MGGKLEIIKTKYVLMIWIFDGSGKPILMDEQDLPLNDVEIPKATGQNTVLERIPVQKGFRMLGVRQAGIMQMEIEFDHQLGKTCKFACTILTLPLKKHEYLPDYRSVYIPPLTYGFAAMSFTKMQHEKTIATLNSRLLSKIGFHPTMPEAVLFATTKFSGIGLLHPHCKQIAAKI
eukprot:2868572-Ditylum_brightwellii.AAC.2